MIEMKKRKYKCTYTSEEGAICWVMSRYKEPNPDHCFAYDCRQWLIDHKVTCKNCVPLEDGEKPKNKIWCDQMSDCDSYNDGGEEHCESCPCKRIVFKAKE